MSRERERCSLRREGAGRVPARRLLALAWIACICCLACSESPKRFHARGVVRGVDPDAGQVSILHEDIPGLMRAMTMSFDVVDRADLRGLEPGQEIEFVVISEGGAFRVDEIEVTGSAVASGEAGAFDGLPEVGAPAPDFALTDQDGRAVALSGLRGRTVLLDFIYTSCPGPCPILSATHVSVQKRLPRSSRPRMQFVSISLDPERDTPEALRAYGRRLGAELDNWSFLTGSPAVVQSVVASYGIGSVRSAEGEIEHVVATFLIDGDGRISQRYLGLDHAADDLLSDIERLLEG